MTTRRPRTSRSRLRYNSARHCAAQRHAARRPTKADKAFLAELLLAA